MAIIIYDTPMRVTCTADQWLIMDGETVFERYDRKRFRNITDVICFLQATIICVTVS